MSEGILQIAVTTPVRRLFDYLPPLSNDAEPLPGCRVMVPFGRRKLLGIIVASKTSSELDVSKLKRIETVLDPTPLFSEKELALCQWASQYYQYSLGEVFSAALPKLLREGRAAQFEQERLWTAIKPGDQAQQLSRAAKQQTAFTLLVNSPGGLTDQQLKAQGVQKTTLSSLQKKEFVAFCWQEVSPTLTPQLTDAPPKLNAEQAHVVTEITEAIGGYQPFLIQGVTGSGKTEVYLRCIEVALSQGKQSLVLVPEIGLTPQTIERFARRFAVRIVLLHSGLSDRERKDAWVLAQRGEAKIVIGTRSAIFTPMPDLGLVIVDEEHDTSYKQQDSFRYSARDLAVVRAQQNSVPVVLGSATPSLESLYNAKRGRYKWLQLSQRAGGAVQPKFNVIDLRKTKMRCGLTSPVFYAIKDHLQKGNQVLLFINRRGYAPILMCHACGWVADCKHCDAHLTLHHDPSFLQCHHCGARQGVMKQCPTCQQEDLCSAGVGTQRLQEYLLKHFADWPVLRIDRDTTRRKHAMTGLLDQINTGAPAILLGTQMLAKGHHFPNVTLVVILNCDSGFFSGDFRACEHTGQLITQVSGRAGRAEKPGEVYIQTHHPDHPMLLHLIQNGYPAFADNILQERQAAMLPPFSYLAVLRAESDDQQAATDLLETLKTQAPSIAGCELLGPIPAAMEKRAGFYRAHLLLQASNRKPLQQFSENIIAQLDRLKPSKKIKWSLDIDPIEVV